MAAVLTHIKRHLTHLDFDLMSSKTLTKPLNFMLIMRNMQKNDQRCYLWCLGGQNHSEPARSNTVTNVCLARVSERLSVLQPNQLLSELPPPSCFLCSKPPQVKEHSWDGPLCVDLCRIQTTESSSCWLCMRE